MKFLIGFIAFSFFLMFSLELYSSNCRMDNETDQNKDDMVPGGILTNRIFKDDVFVKDYSGKIVSLKKIDILKDTVLVFVWCKSCGACIYYLNWMKAQNKQKNYQILAIAITKNDTIEKERAIVEKYKWPFQIYFDENQNLAKYFTKCKYYKESNYERKEVGFHGFPKAFMFVRNEFFCYSCDKYVNPFMHKKTR